MKIIEPCTLVIFGAAGNLSRRKLLPALFSLERLGRLPDRLVLLGCNLEQRSREEWVEEIRKIIAPLFPQGLDQAALDRFCARWHYHSSAPGDDTAYPRLKQMIEVDEAFPPNVIFYMAVRPSGVQTIIEKLGGVGFAQTKKWLASCRD